MKRVALDAWITAMRAAGYWCTPCESCHAWFAQLHRKRAGARAKICRLYRCELYRRWQRTNGRAPPEWLLAKWLYLYADEPRKNKPKAHDEPRWCGTAA